MTRVLTLIAFVGIMHAVGFPLLASYLAGRAARTAAPPQIMGFMAQAGVTLGIANIIKERFPIWGVQVATIIIAMIAVNQLVGPPAFRWALIHAGESHAPAPGRRVRR